MNWQVTVLALVVAVLATAWLIDFCCGLVARRRFVQELRQDGRIISCETAIARIEQCRGVLIEVSGTIWWLEQEGLENLADEYLSDAVRRNGKLVESTTSRFVRDTLVRRGLSDRLRHAVDACEFVD